MHLYHIRLVPELSGGTGTENGYVTIKDGKICEVSALPLPEELKAPDDVDGGGKTLLPGLIDLHTHITVLRQVGLTHLHQPMALVVDAAAQATHYLDHGFTTIRDCGSALGCANYVRSMQEQGLITAPDLITCGRAIMPTEVDEGNPLASHLSFADGPDEIRKAVRTECGNGAQFIKIFASGAAADPNGKPAQAIMTREEIHTAVETAGIKGQYVAAHCHSDAAIRLCLQEGVHSIEHATLISNETLELAKNTPGACLIPTLAVMYIGDGPRKAYWQARLGPMFDHCTKAMKKAYQMGLTLGFGTDCAAGSFEYEHGIEFRFRAENCHMAPKDILLQASAVNARIAGIEDQVGTIEKDHVANLILVDGKPEEDISCMYQRPAAVFLHGRKVR